MLAVNGLVGKPLTEDNLVLDHRWWAPVVLATGALSTTEISVPGSLLSGRNGRVPAGLDPPR